MKFLKKTDSELHSLIQAETKRQKKTLMMIPSENIVSKAVEEAVGSPLGNKYAEGYPFKRYYQGQAVVDQIEDLVQDRVRKAFDVPYANVQPLSGSPANLAVYVALLKPHETMMGLSLAFGGHLTHGASVSATSVFFRSVPYRLTKSGFIDYEEVEKLALREKPKIIVAGTTAYPRKIEWKRFAEIAEKVDAYLMADVSHLAGLILAEAYPSPTPHVHIITTTTHKTLRGPRGAIIMVTKKGLKKDPELAEKISKAVFPGLQGGPHMNSIAGIGVAFKEASKKSFKTYCHQIVKNAQVLSKELMERGLHLVSSGTDSHLLLIDLTNKNLLGNTVAEACEAAGIVLNRNAVPYDPNPPFYPSGIRLGTPGITSRGMKENEMKKIAKWISEIIDGVRETKQILKFTTEDEKKRKIRQMMIKKTPIIKKIEREVKRLCNRFPIKSTY
ncbi:serine hydroxymethyltransferase [Candidatus Roizmanbacteria bacterium CG09_land_8_20_14_0_10_41_9]|uniref:Serine hydroxymethyltransferase n=1 Tax=Candidatus Roizmanbacteria bacterium CG09_land_8_20_14_0_10_41_9 TaxID=1974850 RepID=A0A2H0WSG1_9BACT|nr:MAG: serine hydroxymethyltransferase [Candidatus Roizmanbacteria bacterium CG09_land_8_20_14_0_10_41_9]